MSAESVPQSKRGEFYDGLFDEDIKKSREGDTKLIAGSIVTVRKDNFDLESLYLVTKIFPDGTYELANESVDLRGMRFKREELIKFDPDLDIFDTRKKVGHV
jgi:adenine-specific DNA methylase